MLPYALNDARQVSMLPIKTPLGCRLPAIIPHGAPNLQTHSSRQGKKKGVYMRSLDRTIPFHIKNKICLTVTPTTAYQFLKQCRHLRESNVSSRAQLRNPTARRKYQAMYPTSTRMATWTSLLGTLKTPKIGPTDGDGI